MHVSAKEILISGANRGIGAALVREFLKFDVARIYAAARDVNSLPDWGDGRVSSVSLDVTDDASVAAAAAGRGSVDILVNNAGTMGWGDWLTTPQETLDRDMETNFHGTRRMVRAFAPAFLARGSGTIVNMVSIVGLAPVPMLSGYSASKAALHSLTQALRATMKKSGVDVIGVYPGPVDTELAKDIPLTKVSAADAARRIVEGIATCQPYIFPDPMAEQIEQLWRASGPQVEAALQIG
jgi:NAD(P)-dependent dehydrogenase (short-subunit alcohol dehydrogenase family)